MVVSWPGGSVKPANNLYRLLNRLLEEECPSQWVSATVVSKHRSSYRKPGALMLVSPLGHTFGLISGGCLESDIVIRARRVLEYRCPELVVYDSTEDGNIAAELGLGCNGRIQVLIEEIGEQHQRLYRALLDRMTAGMGSFLLHCLGGSGRGAGLSALLDEQRQALFTINETQQPPVFLDRQQGVPFDDGDGSTWVITPARAPVRLLIVGGGIDAQPVAALAAGLGWRVAVADHRTVNARRQNFPAAERLIHSRAGDWVEELAFDAVIIMSHNLDNDAEWLVRCQSIPDLRYLGLLGPVDRKLEVLALAGLDSHTGLAGILHGPMGIDIGGDLPESVALSTIAQCHQVLASHGIV